MFKLLKRKYNQLNKMTDKFCVSMTGKTVIVTGANSGIGFQTAKDLAKSGARVILACRNENKGEAARNSIVSLSGNHNVVFRKLDLASLSSVRNFAKEVLETEDRLDVLINNAGVYGHGDRCTEDNIVEGMQTNYFGPFLLTCLLIPLLQRSAPSRIVNVTSMLHFIGDINIHLLNKKSHYSELRTYCNSKLCSISFTVELSRRLKGTGVIVNAVHPGITKTNIGSDGWLLTKTAWTILCWVCGRPVEVAAQMVIFMCVSTECADVSGEYYMDCEKSRVLQIARDPKVAMDLWQLSEQLVNFKFVSPI